MTEEEIESAAEKIMELSASFSDVTLEDMQKIAIKLNKANSVWGLDPLVQIIESWHLTEWT